MTIHERIIARLEELKTRRPLLDLEGGNLSSDQTKCLIAMAIDNVSRKCPKCGDTGRFYSPLHGVEMSCPCNRPAYLEECERRLNG